MWKVRTKNSLDYIQRIIKLARHAKAEIVLAQQTGKNQRTISLLRSIKKFEKAELQRIEEETGSTALMEECLPSRS
jgi:uncharacterized protein (DUF2344 family)